MAMNISFRQDQPSTLIYVQALDEGDPWLMQVGIDQGYMPIQPIHYSHKIHSV